MMNMPEDVTALNIISIGYPKMEQKPKQKWDDVKLHKNAWGADFENANSTPISYKKSVADAITHAQVFVLTATKQLQSLRLLNLLRQVWQLRVV